MVTMILKDDLRRGCRAALALAAAGSILAGCLVLTGCAKDVVDQEMVITYQDKTIAGQFTGTLEDGYASHGKFVGSDEKKVFEFDGDWGENNAVGNGTLDCACYEVHFSDVDREGHYVGDVVDGVASGEGKFSAKNDEGVKYTYDGEWTDGLFNGHGHQRWADGQTYDGTFANGEFTPTVAEAFAALGAQGDGSDYEVSEKADKFLGAHPDLFDNYKGKVPGKLVNKNPSYMKMSKSIGKYGDKLIKVSGLEVRQIWDSGTLWGYKNSTYLNVLDSSDNVYSVQMFSKTKGIYKGSHITLTMLPLDFATYENVGGGKTWAIMGAGVKAE